jgi:hypothetical protein
MKKTLPLARILVVCYFYYHIMERFQEMPPIRISLQLISGVRVFGHIFKHVLETPVNGALVQMWVKFEDKSIEDMYISDDRIKSKSVEVINPVRVSPNTVFNT